MERIEDLIDKLVAQKHNGSTAAQMLITVQLLQNELLVLQQSSAPSGSRKVAVIMPTNNTVMVANAAPATVAEEKPAPKIQVLKPAPVKQMEISLEHEKPVEQKAEEIKKQEPVRPQPVVETVKPEERKPIEIIKEEKPPQVAKEEPKVAEPYYLRRPVGEDFSGKEEVKVPEPKVEQPVHHFPFDAMAETPTLLQQQPPPAPKEVHELIGERKESLNDRLKQEKTEVVHQLKDTPVKDLRKAIGINDKFLFVNELFRGDEGMYERSIKTINNFHILPEAEYWMNRELKVKLGWNDSKETVQHFYSLVRRRFS